MSSVALIQAPTLAPAKKAPAADQSAQRGLVELDPGEHARHFLARTSEDELVYYKLARDPLEEQDLRAEAALINGLREHDDLGELLTPYLPDLVEELELDPDQHGAPASRSLLYGPRRLPRPWHTLAFRYDPHFYTLEELHAAYLEGLEPKDAAWIFRRLLMALGLVHNAGMVHCQISPRHILICPEQHGLVLLDWTRASTDPEAPLAWEPTRYTELAAPELDSGEPAGPETDIFMAARSLQWALAGGREIPRKVGAYLRWLAEPDRAAREADAWELLDEFDHLLEDLWGPKRFHPMTMPPRALPETLKRKGD